MLLGYQNSGCALIRACALIRMNTVYLTAIELGRFTAFGVPEHLPYIILFKLPPRVIRKSDAALEISWVICDFAQMAP